MSVIENLANNSYATVSARYLAAATSIEVNDTSRLPAPPFRANWYDHKNHPDVDSDVYREIIRVTAISGTTLTIERGVEGTAYDHDELNATYRIKPTLTAVSAMDNFRAVNIKNPEIGGVGNGTADDGPAVQKGFNRIRDYGGALYFPTGEYRILTAVTEYTGTAGKPARPGSISIIGDGESSIIADEVSTGPCIDIDESGLKIDIKDVALKVNINKATKYGIYLQNGAGGKISGLSVNGNSKKIKAAVAIDGWKSLTIEALECLNVLGISMRLNGTSHIALRTPTFSGCPIALAFEGQIYGLKIDSPYFAGAGGVDHITGYTPDGSFAAASTSINLPTGLGLVAGDTLWIGNDDNAEVVLIASYTSGSGVATLEWGLAYTYTNNVELISGDKAFACGSGDVKGMVISTPYFYRCAGIIRDVQGGKIDGAVYDIQVSSDLGNSFSYGAYVFGAACFGIEFGPQLVRGDRGDSHFLRIVNSAAHSNQPTWFTVGQTIRDTGSGITIATDDYSASSTPKVLVLKEGIKTTNKVLAAGGIGVGNSQSASAIASLDTVVELFDEAGSSLGYVPISPSFTP